MDTPEVSLLRIIGLRILIPNAITILAFSHQIKDQSLEIPLSIDNSWLATHATFLAIHPFHAL